jgi:hypothetical protein
LPILLSLVKDQFLKPSLVILKISQTSYPVNINVFHICLVSFLCYHRNLQNLFIIFCFKNVFFLGGVSSKRIAAHAGGFLPKNKGIEKNDPSYSQVTL